MSLKYKPSSEPCRRRFFEASWSFGQLIYRLRTYFCRASVVHTRQSRPYSGLGFQVKVLRRFELFPLRSEAAQKKKRSCDVWGRAARVELIPTLGALPPRGGPVEDLPLEPFSPEAGPSRTRSSHDEPPEASRAPRVDHLGRSTCHAISGREGWSTTRRGTELTPSPGHDFITVVYSDTLSCTMRSC